MRNWMSTICILFAGVVCHGQETSIGPASFALGDGTPKTTVEKYYEDHSILKVYENGEWKDAKVERTATGSSVLRVYEGGKWRNVESKDPDKGATYVISHGLNDTYGSGWINKSADAIASKNSDAIILSVNWDHYSGTKSNIKDSNFGASSWINSVSPILAKELKGFANIKSFVGHSYGAHLLADTMVKMYGEGKGKSNVSFVALDPAEETLTYTGTKTEGSPTTMWSDNKKSKDWGLPDNVTCEVYKSSGFLGAEERLGNYNYFLAAEGSITPRAVFGDLDSSNKKMDYSNLSDEEKEKGLSNHSLAPAWFAEFITNQKMGGYAEDGNLIGGWFNAETDNSRGDRPSDYWDGVVNATSSVNDNKPQLEYAARENQKFTEWQDLLNAEAQNYLHKDLSGNTQDNKSNWQGTVLNPSKYDGYMKFHGNDQVDSSDQKNDAGVSQEQINDAMKQLRTSEEVKGVSLPYDAVLNNADTSDPKEMAFGEWQKQLAELGKDMTSEDRNLLQQVGDVVRKKIEEGIEKGEEWVKNGGIRDLIQKTLDSALDGRVSDADKAHIKNLADKLCNVGQDGGRSFAEALGKDGVPLLRSLAVQQLQKEISKSLPKDVADNVNNYIQMLAVDGYDFLDPAVKQQLLDTVKSAITEYLPYETSAATLNKLLQDIYDGKSVDVLDAAKDLGNSIAVDALRDAIKKNMDPEAAGPLLAALDGYVKSGFKVPGAVQGGLDALIDKYAPGAESAAELKNVLNGIMNGTATMDDLKRATSAVFADKMKAMVDASNLSPEAKRAAKDAIDVLKKNGITGITTAAETFINDYVTDKLGPEAGKAASDIFHAVVTPGADIWSTVKKELPKIAQSIATKLLAKVEAAAIKQINAFIGKHPVLKDVFSALGIDGKGIVNGIKNVWGILKNAKSLKDALTKIGKAVVQGLKKMLVNLVKWGLNKVAGWLNNLVKKAAGWIADKLGSWASKVDNALLKKGLQWLQSQASRCKKNGAQKVLSNLSSKAAKWIEGKILPQTPSAPSQNVVNQPLIP